MRKSWGYAAALMVVVSGVARGQAATSPGSCADLAKLTLPNTKIMLAEQVAAGKLPPPGNERPNRDAHIFEQMPAFCRVVARIAPSADSDIKVEIWMPVTGWNGKFRGQGNGGFAGSIDYTSLALSVSQGYASGGTDTGHEGTALDASWALGHPEKIVDFGWRAVHEMTWKSRAVVQAYYGTPSRRSYFASCSDGGREALMEAQRFPEDYDGILAGAPAYHWTHLLTAAVDGAQLLTLNPASYIPASKLPAISSAVLAACDASDGVKDGILNDPRTCRFDPSVLLCKGANSDSCLTGPQVTALKSLYDGTRDSKGELVNPGLFPGAETGPGGWTPWITGTEPGKSAMFGYGVGYFANMVYEKADWDYKTFTVDEGLKAAMAKTAGATDAVNPDLQAFAGRGGKLILYHGWNDPAIPSLGTIDYYNQVKAAAGEKKAAAFVRLFMVPGLQHCYGGPGADSFGQTGWRPGLKPDSPDNDMYLALEQWVEKGVAPEKFVATKYAMVDGAYKPVMTRPLCAYPRVVKYKGSGDSSDAANFVCAAPGK